MLASLSMSFLKSFGCELEIPEERMETVTELGDFLYQRDIHRCERWNDFPHRK